MKFATFILCFLTCGICVAAQKYPCLPDDIKEDSVVTVVVKKNARTGDKEEKVTVKQTLKKLNARCSKNKLVDRKGKAVYFYKLQGCWGNPPADYLEILDAQRKELADLKKKYTVIEMTCNSSGIPLPQMSPSQMSPPPPSNL